MGRGQSLSRPKSSSPTCMPTLDGGGRPSASSHRLSIIDRLTILIVFDQNSNHFTCNICLRPLTSINHVSKVAITYIIQHSGAVVPADCMLFGEMKTDMAHNDMVVTSSFLRTTGPSMWLAQRGKLVGRRYGGASGRATDLAQVRSTPQRSYDRPDTGKADTSTCGRIPHHKDGGRGGSVRR
ncbi:hypothetical protein GW17_00030926 [Ensete ventricosum]|nr:hypothetical protein GW17_00030926 [Ensete ventricosum]